MATPPPRAAGPILVTAFEPFGTSRRPNRGANASREVLFAWRERHPERHRVLVLPVSVRAEIALARALEPDLAGVVAMGEADLPGDWDTNLEPWAEDRPVRESAAEAAADRATLRLESAFAAGVPPAPGLGREARIGAYWCNRVYFRILDWCRWNPRPAAFLHLRVGGDRERQYSHLEHVLAAMEGTAP